MTIADTELARLQAATGKGLPFTIPDLTLEELKSFVPNPNGRLLTIQDFLVAKASSNLLTPEQQKLSVKGAFIIHGLNENNSPPFGSYVTNTTIDLGAYALPKPVTLGQICTIKVGSLFGDRENIRLRFSWRDAVDAFVGESLGEIGATSLSAAAPAGAAGCRPYFCWSVSGTSGRTIGFTQPGFWIKDA